MQAIILAAGMGKRLKDHTKNNTKCMVEVNGVKLIDRMLHQIEKYNLNKIIIVVGYEGQKLIDHISSLKIKTPIHFIDNTIYDKTNNIYSLSLAKDLLIEDDTLLFESDLIFEDSVLDLLINDIRPTLTLVDKYESWMDGTCVTLSDNDEIESFVPGKNFDFNKTNDYYKTVNIYKFSKKFSETHYVPFLEAYTKALGNNEYYEQVLKVITMLDNPEIKAIKLNGQLWYEIDDVQDLDIASSLFANDDIKLDMIQRRYGGYWRYPKMIDFCYLVNPYYPSKKLLDELKANFNNLVTQYPSGMSVNALLAAKNFNVDPKQIIVGNGAAELIKPLMDILSKSDKKIGYIRPTFEEYPNRNTRKKEIVFISEKEDFSYNADDLIEFFDNKDICSLVIINPDNPTGNYIIKKDLLKLIDWTHKKGIFLIVDESFVDFSYEENSTLIDKDLLAHYENLIVVKSISKSYGIPGIRLGVLVSGNNNIIAELKKDVAIWNINSLGEFYMQIAEKYKNDYKLSLDKLKQERKRFVKRLHEISGLEVIPSQANYIMLKITNGITSKELTKKLLTNHNILIKDLSPKFKFDNHSGEYIRVAVRNSSDNDKLVEAITYCFLSLKQ